MRDDPRAIIERAARELVSALGKCPVPPTLRVAEVEGRFACLIQVWDSAEAMPTIGPERRRRASGARAICRADILEMIRAGKRPQTQKEVVKGLRDTGKQHGSGTVVKALADLTASGQLANPRDKKGYRLPQWMRRRTPGLFD